MIIKQQRPNRRAHRPCTDAAMLILTLILVAYAGCGGNEKTIPYEVLRKWDVKTRGFGMEILVDEAASREDVMNLAKSLQRQHAGKYLVIDIFDSREAWQHRDDDGYPEKEYWRHYLVQIAGKFRGWEDGQEIHWVAEGRDH